jgi:putative lipoic acid-binding regulatory protein
MTEQKQDVAKEEETLVEFPCDFFIKVIHAHVRNKSNSHERKTPRKTQEAA